MRRHALSERGRNCKNRHDGDWGELNFHDDLLGRITPDTRGGIHHTKVSTIPLYRRTPIPRSHQTVTRTRRTGMRRDFDVVAAALEESRLTLAVVERDPVGG